MKLGNLFAAGLIGLSFGATLYSTASAQSTLTIMRGATSDSIKVDVNRAIVMESDQPFSELSVANPGIADIATLSDRTIYVLGKAPGRTTLTLLGADGRLITNVDVQVSPDIAEFKERLAEILPKEKIDVRTANGGIVLSGRVSSIRSVDRAMELAARYSGGVSNMMIVGGSHQVMLKVRFAEMQRAVAKSLSASIGIGGLSGNVDIGAASNKYVLGGNLQSLIDGAATSVSSGANGAFNASFGSGGLAISVLLEALENKGLSRTLAEPNLVALSGNKAHFLAGGEYPIPVQSSDGIAIEYRNFGVEMTFEPTLIEDGLINLVIETAVSALDAANSVTAGGTTVQAFTKREAQTVVEIKDGQSMAIAGLLQDDFSDLAGQVPWLGDIPVLGALFRSSEYARNQTELVIIVTPHIVSPVDGDALALPTDRIRPPTEADLFLLGKTVNTINDGSGSVASQDYKSSYGYVME
jgi:pilus assembly protein CpaC